MAAEALEQAGKKLGHEVLVETQGSAGSNPFKQDVIDAADGVIFAVFEETALRGSHGNDLTTESLDGLLERGDIRPVVSLP